MDSDQSQLKTVIDHWSLVIGYFSLSKGPRTKDQGPRTHVLFPLCLSLLLSVGCRIAGGDARVLRHAQPSAEALAGQVLEALRERDEPSLKNLVLTKEEFCNYVWPELPSSRIKNLTCDWVWSSYGPSNAAGLRHILGVHGGNQYRLVRVRFARGTTEYESFKVHEDARVVVADSAGRERELKLFGSILDYEGQFKLFSFIID
jgi:hypothetical protein